jgi:hypothetical protein
MDQDRVKIGVHLPDMNKGMLRVKDAGIASYFCWWIVAVSLYPFLKCFRNMQFYMISNMKTIFISSIAIHFQVLVSNRQWNDVILFL